MVLTKRITLEEYLFRLIKLNYSLKEITSQGDLPIEHEIFTINNKFHKETFLKISHKQIVNKIRNFFKIMGYSVETEKDKETLRISKQEKLVAVTGVQSPNYEGDLIVVMVVLL